MLILFLKDLFAFLLKLVIPPPAATTATHDLNAQCPACGHRLGYIKFERIVQSLVPRLADPQAQEEANRKALADAKPAVRHFCLVCSFSWYEAVLSRPEHPAL
jgi:hypothetical protein